MERFIKRFGRYRFEPYALIFPAFCVVFGLAAYSTYWLVRMSLSQWVLGASGDEATWIGIDNYRWLLFDEHSTFWVTVKTTAIYVAGTIGPELIIGLGLALLLNAKVIGRSIYTSILIIPIVVIPSMVGMVWRLHFSYDGLINYFIETIFHTRLNWYGSKFALLAVILVDIWEWTPFFILILLAGLQALPHEPFEAARADGATGWQVFRYITLPMMAPLILTATILRFMDVLRIFDVIYVLFAGGPGTATTTLPLYVWRTTMVARNVGRGSSASVMLIILIVASTFILVRIF